MHNNCLASFKVLLVAGILFLPNQSVFGQNEEIDSLKVILATAEGKERCEILLKLSYEFIDVDNEVALEYGSQAYSLALLSGDSLNLVKTGTIKASALRRLERLKEAAIIGNSSLAIAERNSFKTETKYLLNSLAITYTLQANYDKALELHFRSLVIRENEGNKAETSTTLNNIGLIYFILENYDKSIEFYNRSLKLKRESKDNHDLDRLFVNIALCYNQLGKYQQARDFIHEGFQVCYNRCSNAINIEGKFGLGVSYYGESDWKRSEKYFFESYYLAKRYEDKRFQLENLVYLARIHIKLNELELAKENLNEAESIAEGTEYNQLSIEIYKEFSNVYSQSQDFKNAFLYQNKYIKIKDSIFGTAFIKNIAKVQTDFEERENKATITYQKWVSASAFTIVLLMVALVAMLYRNNRQKKKINKLLEQKVKDRTKELELSYRVLEQNYKEQNNLILKTSNDIRSPISTMNGLCSLALKELELEEAQDYVKQMHATTKHLSEIVDKLIR